MSQFAFLLKERISGRVGLSPEQIERLQNHFELMQKWNRVINLIRVRDMEEAVELHYCESLFFGALLTGGSTIIDVGSGAGFPGIPIAVYWPERTVTLVESHVRKCVFLRETTRGIENVVVVEGRAERTQGHYDWMVSRAVNWQELLKLAPALSDRVGLLVSEADSNRIISTDVCQWEKVVRIPWGTNRVAALGRISRETS